MIITESKMNMNAARQYASFESKEVLVTKTERADRAVMLDLSDTSKTLSEQMKEHEDALQKEQEEKKKKMYEDFLQKKSNGKTTKLDIGSMQKNQPYQFSSDDDMKLQLVKKLFQSLMKGKLKGTQNNISFRQAFQNRMNAEQEEAVESAPAVPTAQNTKATPSGTRLVKTTITSSFQAEVENTAFQAVGTAKTADGRELSFGVSFEMSRSFCERNESFTQESYIKVDPLVINLDQNVASVSDMKFLFDLDADGKEEQVSFADHGSGFLALDKNGDGVINDGSELFGTSSGDGFKDLGAYDEDGNGWIDEADSIFGKLKIWTKDEDGNDKLLDLKAADVGAISLQNANTQFSLNNEKNHTNGIIQKTGIYLKESGGVGTVQHVDLTL